jgi:flagellar assembly protein FliH
MSTLYDDNSAGMSGIVEAFSYYDTFVRPAETDVTAVHPGGTPEAGVHNENKSVRAQENTAHMVAEARAEGMAEGSRQAAERFETSLAHERQRIADLTLEFHRQRAEYYSKVEIELVHLSLAIAAKILHRESQVDRMVVAGLVKVMLERFQQHTKVLVRVPPEDVTNWTHYFSEQTNLEVVGDPMLEPKACLLETELGVANLALVAQLKEVEQGFFDLLAQRPDSK